ncbi:MAG: glycine--tRNA ligase subunit beta [Holosporaceae bacterium]|jgi:glycyl-tRNA synthetase beta chain|nr:glycine--tRNA ligase subunit beta [Holosporaceae bacterium]
MNNFLLELMVEEIPARMQATAISEFKKLMIEELEKFRVGYSNVCSYISPRRMVFSAKLHQKVEAFVEEKKGPQTTAPTDVIEKFLKANAAAPSDCIEREIDKKKFVFLRIEHAEKNVREFLDEIVVNALEKMQWEKSMRWGTHQFYFVRPLRNIMAVFEEEFLKIKIDKINLESCNNVWGHRFLAPNKIVVKNLDDYLEKMQKAFVIGDSHQRKQIILDEFKKIEEQERISIDVDEKLLEEVVGLGEYPVVLLGKIPEKFMRLPEEAITTPIRVHQRYFSTRIGGKLAPYFVFVANNVAEDGGKTIIAGNERVLNARLSDALFFFEADLKNPLESRLQNLKKIAFNEKLGTVFDRVMRVANVCDYLCNSLGVNDAQLLRRASILAKCDLSTDMVCEFTELQGIMGAHYAKIQGENFEVCDAIRDQYRPTHEITSRLSVLLSLADKIELITSFFAIGKEPTGSKDPFALRRAAIGILKIVENFRFNFNLRELIQHSIEQLPVKDFKIDAVDRVYNFIFDRLKVVLKESGIQHNVVGALTTASYDIHTVYRRAKILDDFLKSENGEKMLAAHRRIKNIIQSDIGDKVDESLLYEDEELVLWKKMTELETKLAQTPDFRDQLILCTEMNEVIAIFFEKILVNVPQEHLKSNRINLLARLDAAFNTVIPSGL